MTVVAVPTRRVADRPPNRRRTLLRFRSSTMDYSGQSQPSTAVADPSTILVLAHLREVRLGGQSIPFTRIEFDLLMFLAAHPRQVFNRDQLLAHVWGFSRGGPRTVDVHGRRLRAKLSDRPLVVTVRGIGYRLADDANVRVIRLPL